MTYDKLAPILEMINKYLPKMIDFWLCFLNGVAGKEHSMDHAIIKALEQEIEHGDMDRLAAIRKNKRSL